jgi:hypothetical protein
MIYTTSPERLYNYFKELSPEDNFEMFSKLKFSMNDLPVNTMKVLFWARDPRCGLGMRRIFRQCISWLANSNDKYHLEKLRNNIHLIPKYGRWDDVFCLFGTKLEKDALRFLNKNLRKGSQYGDIYKWMPREKSSKSKYANKITSYMGITKKEYRKLLSSNTKVVENYMCSNKWEEIDYNEVPISALEKYKYSFYKNDTEKYLDFYKESKYDYRNKEMSYKELVVADMYSLIV